MDRQSHNQDTRKRRTRRQEQRVVTRIVRWIVGIVVVLLVIIGILGYRYIKSALAPVDPNSKDRIAVKIGIGSSTKAIGAELQKKGIIKSGTVFNYYVKFHNVAAFKAGTYHFSKAETLDDIISVLRDGGAQADAVGTVLVKEGAQISDIATTVDGLKAKNPNLTKAKFLAVLKDQAFFDQLAKRYPKLLSSAAAAKAVRYRLEGYLFPATYSVTAKETAQELVTEMVVKADSVMQSYYTSIARQGYSVQQVMTLASLVEREGSTTADRRTIAGVFLNRIAAKMPLQSDLSVMYALNTHKAHLTNKDTAVDSPYNLYVHTGYGPGPFDSPSENSITAVLSPTNRSKKYLYFVANMKTGEILYATTRAQHDANTAKFAADNAAAASSK
ncbi:endolytic transglycosylase MltG [Lacticaseibacillus nasuensis]|uniref:endolytic transglycosylase MltG n=1 Tax=Lacticaseibacillus nasuensis TaxID=944671 RepID=UPI002247F589|nr:endolytic transglycosylase MltG [Lacticaseibacillus nasuensis]MCX2456041.1 endolytic transglycosylase MltG [Lacticaseibacillus nasuensis]